MTNIVLSAILLNALLFCIEFGYCNVLIDCHPDFHASLAECTKRGCIWKLPENNASIPACSFSTEPLSKIVGYDMIHYDKSDSHLKICLKRRPSPSLFGEDHEFVELLIESRDALTLSVLFEPKQCAGKETPFTGASRVHLTFNHETIHFIANSSRVEALVKASPFGVIVRRAENKQVLFDSTDLPGLTFARHFIQITSTVPTINVYGFGHRYHRQLRAGFNWNRLSLFSAGFKPHLNMNLYGFQPFHMGLDRNHQAYGIFLNTTYATEYFLQPDPNLITYRIIGGNLHLIFFAGPRPDETIGQYTKVIGRPMIPPYWGLGYQLSRFGYANLSALRVVWDRNRKAGIPQDVQYVDADYMQNGMDFTLDRKLFGDLPHFVEQSVHGTGRKLVLITDPAIAAHDESRQTMTNLVGGRSVLKVRKPFHTIGNANRKVSRVFVEQFSKGTGVYAAVWMGDTFSTWESMDQSIIGMLDFNLFGIPWTGTDICGFEGEVSEELCLRWSQLGAFYPLSRNHNSNNAKTDQDPAAWSVNTTEAIRNVLLLRYSLLPYLYTLFFSAHINGSTVVKPMFFEFPADRTTHNQHDQFLWGNHLMIAPILQPFTVLRMVYFPKGRWYNALEGFKPIPDDHSTRWLKADIPRDSIGLFLRGGGIIPWQTSGISTTDQMNNSFGITVAMDANGAAEGRLFWDDGTDLQTIADEKYCDVNFQAQHDRLTSYLDKQGCTVLPTIAQIDIAGIECVIRSVTVNQVPHTSFTYSETDFVLRITRLSIDLFSEREVIVQWSA